MGGKRVDWIVTSTAAADDPIRLRALFGAQATTSPDRRFILSGTRGRTRRGWSTCTHLSELTSYLDANADSLPE